MLRHVFIATRHSKYLYWHVTAHLYSDMLRHIFIATRHSKYLYWHVTAHLYSDMLRHVFIATRHSKYLYWHVTAHLYSDMLRYIFIATRHSKYLYWHVKAQLILHAQVIIFYDHKLLNICMILKQLLNSRSSMTEGCRHCIVSAFLIVSYFLCNFKRNLRCVQKLQRFS
jgi:hypothetical protein